MKRLIIITGASRGIGASIALVANRLYYENTAFLLIARDSKKVDEIRSNMLKEKNFKNNKIINLKIDFNLYLKKCELQNLISSSLKEVNINEIEEIYVFYNHGTFEIGSIEQVADKVSDEFQINVTSIWILLSALKELFPLSLVKTQFHVNISSLLASKLIQNCSLYSSTRIARATLFKCLALEEPGLRVLNYQPGPVYTDMQQKIYDSNTLMYDSYRTSYENGSLLQADTTVDRLMNILKVNELMNGADYDFYD